MFLKKNKSQTSWVQMAVNKVKEKRKKPKTNKDDGRRIDEIIEN